MKFIIFLAFLSLAVSEELLVNNNAKRSYICPPDFIRQGHRCYYFSKEPKTWQDSMFLCRNKRSNLAVINRANQDKLIRNFLGKKTLAPLERWLGAVYDWQAMEWKWASGKPLTYNGFQKGVEEDKEKLKWHCIVMDPSLRYRWSPRSCVEKKHFICQTKLKVASDKAKKKLARKYHANKYNRLNEIPVPTIPEYQNSTSFKTPANYSLNDQARFRYLPKGKPRKVKKHSKKSNRRNSNRSEHVATDEIQKSKRKNKYKETYTPSLDKIQWTTYSKKENTSNPFYPRPVIMEFSFGKE